MRFSPRLAVRIPAEIKIGPARIDILIVSMGLDGAFIRNSAPGLDSNPSQNGLSVCYDVPQQGTLEHGVRLARKDAEGFALAFQDMDLPTRLRLWQYIADNLVQGTECPFCGRSYTVLPPVCESAARDTSPLTGRDISSTAKGWRWSKASKAASRTSRPTS